MVPDGVAESWIVDLGLRRGTEWNDWLAAEIHRRIRDLQACWISVAFSHPHPNDYTIERFTGVNIFPIDEWDLRLGRPAITFVWREDRMWHADEAKRNGRLGHITQRAKSFLSGRTLQSENQTQRVVALATILRQRWKNLDFAVVGFGKRQGLPSWITDLRSSCIDQEIERTWCQVYAESHVAVGVHGSNMLLPSAHAGTVVELVPNDRWTNIPEATLFRVCDPREAAYRYRYYPLSISVDDLASAISHLLTGHRFMTLSMPRIACDHSNISGSSTLLRTLRGSQQS